MRVCMHVVQVVVVVVVVVIKMLYIKFVKYIDWPGGQSTLGPVLRAARPGRPARLYRRRMSPTPPQQGWLSSPDGQCAP